MGLLKTIDAKVVGITFKNEDGTDRQEILSFVCDGDPVVIEYYEYRGEPAYSVSTEDGDQIGNLAKELAADIRRKYGECAFDARISELYDFDDFSKIGCRVNMDIYESEDDFPAPIQRTVPVVSSDAATSEKITATEHPAGKPLNTGNPKVSDSTYRVYRVIFMVLGIISLLLGIVALPVTIIFVFLAFFCFWMRKNYGIILRNRNSLK